jgi:hypothetical protein
VWCVLNAAISAVCCSRVLRQLYGWVSMVWLTPVMGCSTGSSLPGVLQGLWRSIIHWWWMCVQLGYAAPVWIAFVYGSMHNTAGHLLQVGRHRKCDCGWPIDCSGLCRALLHRQRVPRGGPCPATSAMVRTKSLISRACGVCCCTCAVCYKCHPLDSSRCGLWSFVHMQPARQDRGVQCRRKLPGVY